MHTGMSHIGDPVQGFTFQFQNFVPPYTRPGQILLFAGNHTCHATRAAVQVNDDSVFRHHLRSLFLTEITKILNFRPGCMRTEPHTGLLAIEGFSERFFLKSMVFTF